MDKVKDLIDSVEELIYISDFMINKKECKKERKQMKNLVEKIKEKGIESVLSDGCEIDEWL
jgi:GH35 family endo-1,4-beta-xylanase